MKTKTFKLTPQDRNYFLSEINKIIFTENFQRLKQYYHHATISTYAHAIKVALLSYEFAKEHKWKINEKELIRAALLHDLYFYDWHDKHNGIHLHGLFHPKLAAKNATELYQITKKEKRHMIHHMFPLTPLPPTTKEGWIICYCDKKAARSDYKAIKKLKKQKKMAK